MQTKTNTGTIAPASKDMPAARQRDDLKLRRARRGDCELLWRWANDPTVRQSALNPDPIPWDVHVNWFSAKLVDETSCILIAEDSRYNCVGQIRFDAVTNDTAEIDVGIEKGSRGHGLGTRLIDLGCEYAFTKLGYTGLVAYVKLENIGSLRAFEKAGFRELGRYEIRGAACKCLERKRETRQTKE